MLGHVSAASVSLITRTGDYRQWTDHSSRDPTPWEWMRVVQHAARTWSCVRRAELIPLCSALGGQGVFPKRPPMDVTAHAVFFLYVVFLGDEAETRPVHVCPSRTLETSGESGCCASTVVQRRTVVDQIIPPPIMWRSSAVGQFFLRQVRKGTASVYSVMNQVRTAAPLVISALAGWPPPGSTPTKQLTS